MSLKRVFPLKQCQKQGMETKKKVTDTIYIFSSINRTAV
ncbi:hypothetical protein LEP1GSC038_3958 [Leptospira weilii str. 2006001855]|uniref:Uncharacterized protein n=1 Tax=Leptospira weilii str. 2006001855 TaxID=996804 RepID=M6FG46_9LEPT|nr:hypothetical protein LEP1GSC038_3958 [Leptospira weilii str. 2006001855]